MAYVKHEWDDKIWGKGQKALQTQLNEMEDGIAEGGAPAEYLRDAAVSGDTLTIAKNGGAEVVFDVSGKADVGASYTKAESDAKYLTSHQDISGKQDKLTAGANITIENNVISASGGASAFKATFTAQQSAGAISLSCDKTVTQILSAVEANRIIDGELNFSGQGGSVVKLTFSGHGTYSQGGSEIKGASFDFMAETTYDGESVPQYSSIWMTETGGVVTCELHKIDTVGALSALATQISSKSQVFANQSLEGDEDELTSLTVDDVKYKISNTRSFPSAWPISGTCSAFLAAIGADTSATVGQTYQGGVDFSDLSDIGLGNAEAEVEIISSTLSTGYKVIRLNVYSATNEPYSWARIYWWKGDAASSVLQPWQITGRAADQYTTPVATGTVNATTGAVTFSGGWSLSKGMYLVNIYGLQSTSQISYTYYFAYGGYTDWMTCSCDSMGTVVSALSGSLTMARVNGQSLGWDSDATIDMYKMR